MRVFQVIGLWALYAATGLVLAVAAAGMSSDLHLRESERPRTRRRTKALGGVSGLLLVVGTVGWLLARDPAAGAPGLARAMAAVGWGAGALASVGTWGMIARDLRRPRAAGA